MNQSTTRNTARNNRLSLLCLARSLGIATLLLMTVVSSLHASEPVGLPKNVCWGDFCGPDQQNIWDRFQAADGLKQSLIPRVYTGICYHHSRSLDPHVPQFGGVLIDKIDEMLFFHGRFSFHISTNPYDGLDVDTARSEFLKNFKIALYDRYAYAEAADSFAPFRYWFRQEEASEDLLLVGFFGFDHTILCSLD